MIFCSKNGINNNLYQKINRRLRGLILQRIRGTFLQFWLYPSYWCMRVSRKKNLEPCVPLGNAYLAEKPNYGAGIGHQLANWNAGLHFSELFDVSFAAFPFSTEKWTTFLGLSEGENLADRMLVDQKIKKVRLPSFENGDYKQISIIRQIIDVYRKQQKTDVLFLLEQDQFWDQQYGTANFLSQKFFASTSRTIDKVLYDPSRINIAVHVRRGDITGMQERLLGNEYYLQVIKEVREILGKRPHTFNIYTQERGIGLHDFERIPNTTIQTGHTDTSDFLHLCLADILITSRSSFSYKPALISKGVRIVPCEFWHGYPDDQKWVLAKFDGSCDRSLLTTAIDLIAKKKGAI